MPFNTPVTTEQQDIIDGGGYTGRDFLLFTPFDIVLQVRPADDSSAAVLTEIQYDNLAFGDYEDVRRDMVYLITLGTSMDDLKFPLHRGRITQLPTADTLYVDEASIALDTDFYITVLNTYEPRQRLRNRNLVDGYLEFEKLAPAIKGLSSSYFSPPTAGEAQFAFSPVGQAIEDGDSIDDDEAWLWEFSGSVTYDVGDATTREIEVTLPEGHQWVTVYCTGANGVTGRFIFEVFVQDLYAETTIYLGAEGADITNSWDDGVNATVNYFEGVEHLLDRTRCTIVTLESWRDGDAGFPVVSFVGYFRQDDNEVRGDATYSILKTRSYTIAGPASLAGEIKLSQIAVNDANPPAAWDDIKLPNPARVIQHLGTRYAFFFELFAIDYGPIDNTWYGGDMDVESPFLLDACNGIAEEIDAQLIFAADGQCVLRRNVSLVTDDAERDGADVIAEIPSGKITVLGYSHRHTDQIAQLVAGFSSYRTADGSRLLIRGTAPAVAFGEGPDFEEIPARLLAANASEANAKIEAGQRTANMLAYRDNVDEITVELDGSYRFIQPSQHQWWHLIVDASETTNNVPFTTAERLMLRSVTHRFSPERGTRTVRAIFRRETAGGLAMILVEVIPAVVPTAQPPRPPMPAYQGAFSPSSTMNYTSQSPSRRNPYGGKIGSIVIPGSPAQQQRAGDEIAPPGCRVQSPPVNFRNPSDVMTPFNTVVGEIYTLFIKGDAQISSGQITKIFNFVPSLPAGATIAVGNRVNGQGINGELDDYTRLDGAGTGYANRVDASVNLGESFLINAVRLYTYIDAPLTGDGGFGDVFGTGWVGYQQHVQGVQRYDFTVAQTASVVRAIFDLGYTTSGSPDYDGSIARLMRIEVDVQGSGLVRGDAFYFGYNEEAGGQAQMYGAEQGLRINSTAVAVPPEYDPNHEYVVEYEGDGNPIPLRFGDTDHSDNENALLRIMVCGPNAGT